MLFFRFVTNLGWIPSLIKHINSVGNRILSIGTLLELGITLTLTLIFIPDYLFVLFDHTSCLYSLHQIYNGQFNYSIVITFLQFLSKHCVILRFPMSLRPIFLLKLHESQQYDKKDLKLLFNGQLPFN